jgi:parvulin-like peptidyl-prolyl isomerase
MVKFILAISLFIGPLGVASGQDLPVVKGKKVVATVHDEPITLEEFNREIAALHQGITGERKVGKEKGSELLNRLINARLIIQEARRMGLDELKELKERVDVFSKVTLREELIEKHVKNIRPDEKEVEKAYQESVKEWKIKSILFEKEEDAKRMASGLHEGKGFDEMLKKFLEDKTGKGSAEGDYLKQKELLPEVAEAVSKMKIGAVSPIVKIKPGFVIFRLENVRYPDDPKIKEEVRRGLLRQKRAEATMKYEKMLKAKYVKVKEPLLKKLDFESKEPGLDNLLKDKRVVAEIQGEKPITVGELTNDIKQQFFHGIDRAIGTKKLNIRKENTLEEMLSKKVLRKEALRLGIDKTERYKNKVKDYEDSMIFGAFIQKAVAPDVKLKEEDLKAYYDSHMKEFTYPEMMKIIGLVFGKRDDAEKAIISLKKETDFQWVKANAEGQVDKNTKGVLDFDGRLLTTKDLTEEVRKAISGAKAGDFRLYESPQNHYYVLYIQEVVPSNPQPYAEAREKIARKVYDDKLKKVVEEYADKLRSASEVKVYLKD